MEEGPPNADIAVHRNTVWPSLAQGLNQGLRAYKAAWEAYLTAAFVVGLFEGEHGVRYRTTALTLAYAFQANALGVVADASPNHRGMDEPPGNDLCINASASNSVQAWPHRAPLNLQARRVDRAVTILTTSIATRPEITTCNRPQRIKIASLGNGSW